MMYEQQKIFRKEHNAACIKMLEKKLTVKAGGNLEREHNSKTHSLKEFAHPKFHKQVSQTSLFKPRMLQQNIVQKLDKSKTPSQGVMQKLIDFNLAADQYELDNIRPNWMRPANLLNPLPGQSRNHVVPFTSIQNDLTLKLNALNNNPNGVAEQQDLEAFCDSLIPGIPGIVPQPNTVTVMRNRRTNAINAINNNAGPAVRTATARELLSSLNSSGNNVRLGDDVINLNIGENIDANFLPNVYQWQGGQHEFGGGVAAPAQNVLRLTPNHESLLYNYQMNSDAALTFVIDPNTNLQLSSGTGPNPGFVPAAPLPVLVEPPAGAGALPILYQ
ncbi:hypothetical protein EYS14_19485 [Alteromonadaceae bacterium M269]|nr:hypothetical protein EYS14_19485 [Alteromonadaceae bacterium M269]